MATTQPTPPPANPTTGSEETPPTTNQHAHEPVDPLTLTTTTVTDNVDGDVQSTVVVTL